MKNNIINEMKTKIVAGNDIITMNVYGSTVYNQIEVFIVDKNSPFLHVLCFGNNNVVISELQSFYEQLKLKYKKYAEDPRMLSCTLIKIIDNAKLSQVLEKIFTQEPGISGESKKEFLEKVQNLFNW